MKIEMNEQAKEAALAQARDALTQSGADLDRLSDGCCMAGRSTQMKNAYAGLERAVQKLADSVADSHAIGACMTEIESFGSTIGRLHVSCCTPVREKLYQSILHQLSTAHLNLARAAGTGH